jgi:endonuclease I
MRLTKRFLSFVLVLALSLSLLPAAEAKTGTLVSNTGTRHEVCTALSSQAQAYYTGNYTYDAVSALSGSSSAPMNSALFNRLSTLMRTTMTNSVSYNSLTNYWPKTDANNGSGNPVLFYSDEISGNFNREHVWPKSRGSFKETNAGSDLHHLRPTNADINSTRGNKTMGNVKGVYSTYKTKALNGGTVLWYNTDADVVEVRDNIKGDVARILLYVWCRWQEPNLYENDPNPTIGSGDDANNGLKVIESLDTLLEWMELDPVDTWEMSRNDQCENVQGNRNVFIDYPEYAWLLFGLTPPSDYQTPSGEAMNTTSFTITAVANNSAWGSVSLSGCTVTATPNTGYYAESATVSPAGAATLTQSGNTFTVSNLTADCTVTVNFAAKTACTVSFAANGGTGTMASQQVYAGEDFTLPACGFTAPGGQRFAGWKWSLDNAVYQPNATVTVNGDCTFTAQWQALSSDAEYVLVETAPADWSGDYLIVCNAGPYAMDGSLTSLDATSNYKTVTLSDKTITVSADENDFYFTVEPNGSGYAIKAASGKYIGWASNNGNGLTSSDTALPITLSLSGTDANIVGSAGAYLRFNAQSGQTRFRFYKSNSYSSQKAVSLYKRTEVAPPEPATPAFMKQSLLLDGKIGVKFYLDLPEIDGVDYAESYMTFAITGKGTVTERDDYDLNDKNQNGQYFGFTCYVGSIQMADTITATFHYGDGLTIGKTYAVKDYFTAFDAALAENPNAFGAKIQNLVKSVADYGHYVQPFLAAQNGWTIGTDYAEMTKFYTTSYDVETIRSAVAGSAISIEATGSEIGAFNFSLVLDSETTIRLFVSRGDGYTGPVTFKVDGVDAEATQLSNGRLLLEIPNLGAHMLSRTYTVSITTENSSATVTVSALSYANILFDAYATAAAENAACALWAYSNAADEYLN